MHCEKGKKKGMGGKYVEIERDKLE